ncbi:hypothetical protein SAMN05216462_2686 [Xylanibacter ruminicola]|uniref:Uncharacterized protein n=1 Tax=Xylanibacter ruminicola TaxID=839 RepID=A0A1M7K6L6_XYLRU|nr:hypothetical protein SAMN05216462_2686 [Xylanibacter ruminicola]SFC65403.1 hypothetical protein SAMN04488493_11318 [Xylanibacter ruminicola]SHM60477.1 hypothetical protein SAMN04488494_2280 [Xylanibacter ruminicola]
MCVFFSNFAPDFWKFKYKYYNGKYNKSTAGRPDS